MVRHVHVGHGPGLYALARGADQEYLCCDRCGRVTDVDPAALDGVRAALIGATSATDARFSHFPIHGLCASCASPQPGVRPRRVEGCGDRRLTVGDAAVVGRQPLRHEHAQAGASSASRRRARAAAGSGTRRRRARRARPCAAAVRRTAAVAPGDARRGSARRRRPRRRPAASVVRRPPGSVGPRVEHAGRLVAAQRVRAALARSASRLELDRRLALVGDLARAARTARRPRRTAGPCSSSAARRARSRELARPARRVVAVRQRRRAGRSQPASTQPRARPSATARGRRASPPGSAHRPQVRRRARSRQVADEQLAAPDASRRCRSPVPSKIAPTAGPVSPCSARHAARWAWWCWTADGLDALALERVARSRGSRGAGRGRRSRARPRTGARSARSPSRERPAASRSA